MKYIHTITNIVEADNREQAKAKLASILDGLEGKTGLDLIYQGDLKDYKEPTNWSKYANELANDIIRDNEAEMIEKYVKPGIAVGKDAFTIFDEIDQKLDFYHLSGEAADGRFVYYGTEALIEVMDCLDQLSEYDDAASSGILEAVSDHWDAINTSAAYALGRAVAEEVQEKIEANIQDRIDATNAQK